MKILCCGILKQELDYLVQNKDAEINYLHPQVPIDIMSINLSNLERLLE